MRPLAIVDRGRGPELVGTRITVYDVLHYLQAGDPPIFIASALGLSTREVDFLIQYIEEHKEEVFAENQKIEERIARGNPPEIAEILSKSPAHARIQKRLNELKQKRAKEAAGEGNSRGQ